MDDPWIYVAGPYSGGDVGVNVRSAIDAAMILRDNGFVPIVPHLFHFANLVHHRPYDYWLAWDFDLLDRCDCLLRLPGSSPGASLERARAWIRDKDVFLSVDDALEWRAQWNG